MIISITPNTGIDRTILVPEFALNKTIRASEIFMGMGGKATDAAWILGKLGIPNLALGFAAGQAGVQMENMLHNRGVQTDFVWVDGETRVNTIIICADGSGQSTFTVPSLVVRDEHIKEFKLIFEQAIQKATCILLGGSLPEGVQPSFYTDLIKTALQHNLPVIFDSSGAGLAAGLESHPTIIKPNRTELQEICGHPAYTIDEVYHSACEVKDRYGCQVIATLGGKGALALLEHRCYYIPVLDLQVSSSAGAGDGILAGLALALSRKEPLEEGLRTGFALANAVLLTHTTADFIQEDFDRLRPEIELLPYPG